MAVHGDKIQAGRYINARKIPIYRRTVSQLRNKKKTTVWLWQKMWKIQCYTSDILQKQHLLGEYAFVSTLASCGKTNVGWESVEFDWIPSRLWRSFNIFLTDQHYRQPITCRQYSSSTPTIADNWTTIARHGFERASPLFKFPPPLAIFARIFPTATYLTCGSVAKWLGRWTCDQQVASSTPGLSTIECNPGQVVNTRASVTKQYNLVPANGVVMSCCWEGNR